MLKQVSINDENYFVIENSDTMRPFFMSIVSAYNHWLFISSNGALTAGRKNSQYALFPYYTDDKITFSSEHTGPKSIFRIYKNNKTLLWEPFSNYNRDRFNTSRNLYKNAYGNKILFEEINHDLKLTFRYEWSSSLKYGFVRRSTIQNHGDQPVRLHMLDGLQNIIPYGVNSDLQNAYSNLVDAYKRSELHISTGLGIYALSAIIVDRAEPSEALKANIVWSVGLENPDHLLSTKQIESFKSGQVLTQEEDVKAEQGAYFVSKEISLSPQSESSWFIIADVNKNHSDIVGLIEEIESSKNLEDSIINDTAKATVDLVKMAASADALQLSADPLKDARHFANSLFNIMRGGVFDNNYDIEKKDLALYLRKANSKIYSQFLQEINNLPEVFTLMHLKQHFKNIGNASLSRLLNEYLPLKFSRRHGDPSRPWNRFSINTMSEEDGSKILDYQGNWRDIFQNWEALALSYPSFTECMIYRFLNASTFDGYNPYRLTKDGFDWETIEPDDPWSYIGYWGDHQIIYLLKFLEFAEKFAPGSLNQLLNRDHFVYAAVPYKIKAHEHILINPKDTIEFDHEWDSIIRERRDQMGSDGALLYTAEKEIYHVNFLEKILVSVLAKLSNFIPDAGIWMNTQRPEWNDANNALVGNGVSMVTLYYLRRYLLFFERLLEGNSNETVKLSSELASFLKSSNQTFLDFEAQLDKEFDPETRKKFVDTLGQIASKYRTQIYDNGFSGIRTQYPIQEIKSFFSLCRRYLEKSIECNRRNKKLYHAYNIIEISDTAIKVSHLSEMLEGQVAVLSSGYLKSKEIISLLDSMKKSALYRKDQNTYLLYPYKNLPGFLERNNISASDIENSNLVQLLIENKNASILEKDVQGSFHFNADLRNAFELESALDALDRGVYGDALKNEKNQILQIYEQVFNHKEFTGRSGTFYGYEGLGSVYWHMVSKLLLAVQESFFHAEENKESHDILDALRQHYHDIYEGIGVHKSPDLYGAFPTDPYSHTPAGKGAQQPGMTGQVKEDFLTRLAELGLQIKEGKIGFKFSLLDNNSELLSSPQIFKYYNVQNKLKEINLQAGSLAFSYCQVPIVLSKSDKDQIFVHSSDNKTAIINGLELDKVTSTEIFERSGSIHLIEVHTRF